MSGNDTPFIGKTDVLKRTPVALDWAEFLVDRCGVKDAIIALQYYESIEWITSDVRTILRRNIHQIEAEGEADHSFEFPEEMEQFEDSPFEVHMGSLWFIGQLANKDFGDFYNKVAYVRDDINKKAKRQPVVPRFDELLDDE